MRDIWIFAVGALWGFALLWGNLDYEVRMKYRWWRALVEWRIP